MEHESRSILLLIAYKLLPEGWLPPPEKVAPRTLDLIDLVLNTYLALFVLIGAVLIISFRMKLFPRSRVQLAFEALVEGLMNFFGEILGPLGAKYAPFVVSFFLSILLMNLIGLIPGFISPTANLNTTVALALIAVVGVQIIAIREIGFLRYIRHFLGEPIWLAPLMFPLHVIGEAAKVLSLSIRLFGNIFGEDTIIAVLAAMSPYFILKNVEIPFIPYQLPMMLFAILTAFLQALVFSVLTSIYIAIFLGEEES